MAYNFTPIYLYDNVRQLLTIGDTFCTCSGDNSPMNNNTLRAHRGIDNKLVFRALGPDRVPFSIPPNQSIYCRIINKDNSSVVFEKICRLGPAKGIITLELNSNDLIPVSAGLYSIVLIRTDNFIANINDYFLEKPMFTDFENNVAMDLEITDQAYNSPTPSITLNPQDWTTDLRVPNVGMPVPSFYSSRIPGNKTLNRSSAVHTFSTYTLNFTGSLEIWGSLEEAPDPYVSPNRWFEIYPSTMSNSVQYTSYTGTQAWTFQANIFWLKFRLIPSTAVLDAGQMLKLIVRT